MKRIFDANLNRAAEALRVLEEIARFVFDDKALSERLKNIRHGVCAVSDKDYEGLLFARDTESDVGVGVENPSGRGDLENVFKANIKRLEQALRVLAEYAPLCGFSPEVFEKARYEAYTLEKDMYKRLKMDINKYRLEGKNLYLVTNSDGFSNDDEFLDAVGAALEGGVGIVQLREKNASARRVIELGKKVQALCAHFGALFIVNDRVDIAKVLDADGVHLGQEDVCIEAAREILGASKIVGISTHAPEQALEAQSRGADYIGVGPVFETPTKLGRTAVGLDYVKWASENVEIPFYAIGGIDLDNVDEVLSASAANPRQRVAAGVEPNEVSERPCEPTRGGLASVANPRQRIAVVRAIINAKSPKGAAAEFSARLSGRRVLK